jgi:3-oxoadipate enol-lactonase
MIEKRINGLDVNEFGKENSLPIVFIHAFPLSCRMWDPQVDAFKNKYHVVIYDLRGFGFSETHEAHLTTDSHVDDLISIIDALKLEKPVICGLSMGGYIALRALEMHQDRFRAAILCDTKSDADTNAAKIKRAEQIKQIRNGDKATFFENFLKNALCEKTLKEKPDTVKILRDIMSWEKEEGVMAALLTMAARTDTTEFLDKINIPVLILTGSEDKLVPPDFAKALNEKIKNSHLEIIPDSGHFPNLEKPEKFNSVVESFLKVLKS